MPRAPTPPVPPPMPHVGIVHSGELKLTGTNLTAHFTKMERILTNMEEQLARLETSVDTLGPDLTNIVNLITSLKASIDQAASDNTTKDALIADLQAQVAAQGPAVARLSAVADKVEAFDVGADAATS